MRHGRQDARLAKGQSERLGRRSCVAALRQGDKELGANFPSIEKARQTMCCRGAQFDGAAEARPSSGDEPPTKLSPRAVAARQRQVEKRWNATVFQPEA